jgi:hypothetical protein
VRLIAVSLSSRCVGDCPFCYVDRSVADEWWGWRESVHDQLRAQREPPTVCIEYGGYNLGWLSRCEGVSHDLRDCARERTMTTTPSLMSTILAGTLKAWGFSAVSLSYDSAKCHTPEEWAAAARRAKAAGLEVGCNYLIERVPVDVPDKLRQEALDVLELEIMQLNARVAVAVDNCLGIQLGHTDRCAAGEEFIHVLSDGTVLDCCFGDKCFIRRKQ